MNIDKLIPDFLAGQYEYLPAVICSVKGKQPVINTTGYFSISVTTRPLGNLHKPTSLFLKDSDLISTAATRERKEITPRQ
jgi:hypothetical protein